MYISAKVYIYTTCTPQSADIADIPAAAHHELRVGFRNIIRECIERAEPLALERIALGH